MLIPDAWWPCFELDGSGDVQMRTDVSTGGGTAAISTDVQSALKKVVTSANKIRVVQSV